MGKEKQKNKDLQKTKENRKTKDLQKIMEVEEINVILRIPRSAASVTINAVLVDEDDNPVKLKHRLSAEDIRAARQAFLDNVEDGDDYDVRYVLTDEGRAYLEELMKTGGESG